MIKMVKIQENSLNNCHVFREIRGQDRGVQLFTNIFEPKSECCECLDYPLICDDYPFSSEMSCDFADESLEHKFHIFKSMHWHAKWDCSGLMQRANQTEISQL